MLFDLRSRGRRTTVRGVYLTLAILMGGGLILFGVGTGVSGGGLLNAFSGGGSSQKQAVSSAERNAEKAVKAHPDSAADWASLLQARWSTATSTGFNATTGTFTSFGTSELNKLTTAWKQYSGLSKNPSFQDAIEAARAYDVLGNYGAAASAWQIVAAAVPGDSTANACIALSAYAAGDQRLGDLASGKALSGSSKSQQATAKTLFKQAKTSPSTAKQVVRTDCEE